MKRSVLLGVLVITLLGAGAAWGQQSATPAQATPTASDLAATMKALEEKLRSTGRVTWTQNYRALAPGAKVERYTFCEELLSVAADPRACSLKVVRQKNGQGSSSHTFYFDEIIKVETLPSEDFLHHQHILVEGQPDFQDSVQPALYSVSVQDWSFSGDFKFTTKEAAEQVASLFVESSNQCSAAPSRPAGSGNPSLSETMGFIAEKLSTQGPVDARWTNALTLSQPVRRGNVITQEEQTVTRANSRSIEYLQVTASPTTCTVSFDSGNGWIPRLHARLSFRHITKIEALALKDYLMSYDKLLHSYSKVQIPEASNIFVLYITSADGESKELYLADEVLANRVAKAMVHAAELCGAGANREPF
jgi:hypothetical protein